MQYELVVAGLGYVGLPLVREAVRAGVVVGGYDIDDGILESLAAGHSHIDDLDDADIRELLDAGLTLSSDPSIFRVTDAIVVCVPTPLSADGGPDLSAVDAVMTAIGPRLASSTLVVLESTSYPGTTEEFVLPILESHSGLRAGSDFHLAYSPERVDPGNRKFGLRNTPKVIGGLTPACAEVARRLYERVVDQVVIANGCREAETAKLLENTYRHVNIALVNEMARFCHELEIDLWHVIELARTKPFGFHAFYPGPGVGGHCIPIDPNYLSHRVKSQLGYAFRFVELAQEINASMPSYVAHRAQEILNYDVLAVNQARILLLGVTYKADVADERESPARALAGHLRAMGAVVDYHDPFVPEWSGIRCVPDLNAALRSADLVILVQNHHVYDADRLAQVTARFLDTRGVTRSERAVRL